MHICSMQEAESKQSLRSRVEQERASSMCVLPWLLTAIAPGPWWGAADWGRVGWLLTPLAIRDWCTLASSNALDAVQYGGASCAPWRSVATRPGCALPRSMSLPH